MAQAMNAGRILVVDDLADWRKMIGGLLPQILYVLPYQLALPMGDETSALSTALMLGMTPKSWSPLVTAVVGIVVLIGFSIWRFGREEF